MGLPPPDTAPKESQARLAMSSPKAELRSDLRHDMVLAQILEERPEVGCGSSRLGHPALKTSD